MRIWRKTGVFFLICANCSVSELQKKICFSCSVFGLTQWSCPLIDGEVTLLTTRGPCVDFSVRRKWVFPQARFHFHDWVLWDIEALNQKVSFSHSSERAQAEAGDSRWNSVNVFERISSLGRGWGGRISDITQTFLLKVSCAPQQFMVLHFNQKCKKCVTWILLQNRKNIYVYWSSQNAC